MDALDKVRQATAAAAAAMAERDRVIAEASATHPYSEIAEAAGLSKPRVQQIVAASRRA